MREARLRARLTQKELADRAGISVRTLREIENGRVGCPSPRSVRQLAAALGMTQPPKNSEQASAGQDAGGMYLRILGPLTLRLGPTPVTLGSARQSCLLALLALHPGQMVPQEEIVDVLWGEQPPPTYLNLVHTYVARLRKLLGPTAPPRAQSGPLRRSRAGYQLVLTDDQLDLLEFTRLVVQARDADRTCRPDQALKLLGQALQLWRGPALHGLDPRLRSHPTVVRATQQRLEATLAYADHALAAGQPDQAITELRTVAWAEPLHEGIHSRLMLALASSGQQAAAVKVFTTIRDHLDVELGMTPSAELHVAYLKVLRHEVPRRHYASPTSGDSRTSGGTGGSGSGLSQTVSPQGRNDRYA
ncbi:BTAD domain-containing putative transcriptional regulator [Streptomyces sp. NPDC020096]